MRRRCWPSSARASDGARESPDAMTPSTLFDKIWSAHEVAPGLLYIDLHLVHEVTSPQAFDGLRLAGRTARRPHRPLPPAPPNPPTDARPEPPPLLDHLPHTPLPP